MTDRTRFATVLLPLVLVSCSGPEATSGPGGLELQRATSGARHGGDALVVDFVAHPPAFSGDDLVLTATGCSGDSESNYNVSFGNSDQGTNAGCFQIITSEGTTLVDDVYFYFNQKQGRIYRVQFVGRDAAGPDGVQYQSDAMDITPQPYSPNGFTLHVHAANVTVWRLKGHLAMKRGDPVGTVAVADLVYR